MAKAPGYFVEQNLGAVDRAVRFLLGTAMLAIPYYLMVEQGSAASSLLSWIMVLSVYPLLSAILGIDPMYRLFGIKSCDLSAKNRCGSFPFQVDALAGHDPQPEDDYEHTLAHSRHKKTV